MRASLNWKLDQQHAADHEQQQLRHEFSSGVSGYESKQINVFFAYLSLSDTYQPGGSPTGIYLLHLRFDNGRRLDSLY